MDTSHQLTQAIELLADLTEAHTAALFLEVPGEKGYRAVAWHSMSRSFRSRATIALGEGLVGYVAKHQTPVDVDRYQQKASLTGLYSDNVEVKAFLAMPVGSRGVLVVDTRKRRIFGEREKKMVRGFAEFLDSLLQLGDTVAREGLYGRILDLLYDVENASLGFKEPRSYYSEVLDAGRRYTGLSMGFICLLHPGRKQYTVEAVEGPGLGALRGRSFPVSQGLIGWVLREGRALTHSRLRPLKGKSFLISPEESMRGYNAFAGAPLVAWRRLVGVWAFAGHTARSLDEEEERALQLAGHQVATSLEHYGLTAALGL